MKINSTSDFERILKKLHKDTPRRIESRNLESLTKKLRDEIDMAEVHHVLNSDYRDFGIDLTQQGHIPQPKDLHIQ